MLEKLVVKEKGTLLSDTQIQETSSSSLNGGESGGQSGGQSGGSRS